MEKQKNYLLLVLKGCAMGAADVWFAVFPAVRSPSLRGFMKN